jgi:outer membrane protein assembly factor BamB
MKRTCWILLLTLLLSSHTFAGDWNQWRGPNRDGLALQGPPLLEALPAGGLEPLWITDDEIPSARGGGWSSPVVADGKVYLFTHKRTRRDQGELPPQRFPWLPPENRGGMSEEQYEQYERNRREEELLRSKNFRFNETIYCLDAATGRTLWTNDRLSAYTRFSQSGSPAVVDGKVYLLGAGLIARCVDAATGKDVWETRLPGQFVDEFMQSSFAVADGVAVIVAGRLFGLDAESGQILWEASENDGGSLHTSPVVWHAAGKAQVIANVAGGSTVCVEPKTGKERWRVQSEAGHATPLIVGDRMVTYGSSRKKGLRCFALFDDRAELLWTYQGTADPGSSPVAVDGQVYVQGEKRLACVDLETGRADWTASLDMNQPRYTSLIAADNKVIYAFDGVLCFSASPEEYEQLINAKVDDAGLMAEETTFRKLLNIDKLETTAAGQQEAERLWRQKFNNSGPLPCASPAMADGKLYVRLKNGLACYDLSAATVARQSID